MAVGKETSRARTYFLNEQHELSRGESRGGGSVPKLAPINWAARKRTITKSLDSVKESIEKSKDPLKDRRYFLLVNPVRRLKKESKDKKKAPDGTFDEPVDYSREHSRAFQRLGLDLLDVTDDGDALVHVSVDGFERIHQLASRLDRLGKLEQSRWAALRQFDVIPKSLRVDESWLTGLSKSKEVDAVIELQPLISRVESDEVIRAVLEILKHRAGEQLSGSGRDFSGRFWFRAKLLRDTIRRIAESLFSVQSIHQPLVSSVALASPRKKPRKKGVRRAKPRGRPRRAPQASDVDPSTLPTVGILDLGVPDGHPYLANYRRGTWIHPDSIGQWIGDHGSLVASRVVFGDQDLRTGIPSGFQPQPLCRYLDVIVAEDSSHTDDKFILGAIENCIATYPDVRVFNLSFSDHRPLDSYDPVERREKLRLTQDLDNLVFARDVAVVVAAGNSNKGQVPTEAYPKNHLDPDWRMGHWALGFNTLTCGSFAAWPGNGSIAGHPGAPSPFCKVGPGLVGSQSPDFSENGGSVNSIYHGLPGLGVFGCNADGTWEDHSGTSFATPVLAQQVAIALSRLQDFCEPGSRPFAATVKSFIAATARGPSALPKQYTELTKLTLGRGQADASRLDQPVDSDAIFTWQGVLENSKDIVRVQLPIPRDWLRNAGEPRLDVFIAWDTPVNAAVENLFGSRRVAVKLKPSPDEKAVRPLGSHENPAYPLICRKYDLKRISSRVDIKGDIWLLELSYEQVCDYLPSLDFSPSQRASFSARLFDEGDEPVSPQSFVQALPIAASMTVLSSVSAKVQTPVSLKVQIR